ncbi:MAG TPA: hypothetical protein IAC41_00080, partial [Candidatus Merdenecus merdavium]|nr:hypothetical protein [Candidatus Merdenecus merdavium]
MKVYMKECHRIATSIVYFLFIVVLIFSWFQNFRGVTKTEIDWSNGKEPTEIGLDRPLLKEPTAADEYFGSKISEDDPDMIMTGVTRALLEEYESNSYATYPVGYYKAVTLSKGKQERVLEILCEITGLSEKQLKNLPNDYFPAVTGTMFSFDSNVNIDSNGDMIVSPENKNGTDSNNSTDKTKKFVSQVTYEQFQELMSEMETLIGENGSKYSKEMMITYFGLSEMNYEEAYSEYQQTIQNDKVTDGFARLFCDYMGLTLGFYPIFIVVILWLKDRAGNTAELIYSRNVSSLKLVLMRYLASITMVIIPVLLLSLESLIPLISFGAEKHIAVDCLAYVKYILWWLLPTVMIVTAIGMFFTLLTDSSIAVILQFLWWFIDKGVTG